MSTLAWKFQRCSISFEFIEWEQNRSDLEINEIKGMFTVKDLYVTNAKKIWFDPYVEVFFLIAHFIKFELMNNYFQFLILLVKKLLWRRKCFRGEAHQWTGLFSLTNSRTLSLRVGCNSYFFPISHQCSFAKKILQKLSIICIFWHIFTSSSSLFVFLFGWLSIFLICLTVSLSMWFFFVTLFVVLYTCKTIILKYLFNVMKFCW